MNHPSAVAMLHPIADLRHADGDLGARATGGARPIDEGDGAIDPLHHDIGKVELAAALGP
jgi:hypothetical protein